MNADEFRLNPVVAKVLWGRRLEDLRTMATECADDAESKYDVQETGEHGVWLRVWVPSEDQ
jgi:hypothetical protein